MPEFKVNVVINIEGNIDELPDHVESCKEALERISDALKERGDQTVEVNA